MVRRFVCLPRPPACRGARGRRPSPVAHTPPPIEKASGAPPSVRRLTRTVENPKTGGNRIVSGVTRDSNILASRADGGESANTLALFRRKGGADGPPPPAGRRRFAPKGFDWPFAEAARRGAPGSGRFYERLLSRAQSSRLRGAACACRWRRFVMFRNLLRGCASGLSARRRRRWTVPGLLGDVAARLNPVRSLIAGASCAGNRGGVPVDGPTGGGFVPGDERRAGAYIALAATDLREVATVAPRSSHLPPCSAVLQASAHRGCQGMSLPLVGADPRRRRNS